MASVSVRQGDRGMPPCTPLTAARSLMGGAGEDTSGAWLRTYRRSGDPRRRQRFSFFNDVDGQYLGRLISCLNFMHNPRISLHHH